MPRYYFHVRAGSDLTRDAEGSDLPDIDAARKRAVTMACRAWSERPPDSTENNEMFEIADENGQIVLKVPFSEAFAERAGNVIGVVIAGLPNDKSRRHTAQ